MKFLSKVWRLFRLNMLILQFSMLAIKSMFKNLSEKSDYFNLCTICSKKLLESCIDNNLSYKFEVNLKINEMYLDKYIPVVCEAIGFSVESQKKNQFYYSYTIVDK